MGDVADMMLDGTLCEGCGVYLEGEAHGVPRYCGDCTCGKYVPPRAGLKDSPNARCAVCGKPNRVHASSQGEISDAD